ncbi:ATP-binding protein [Pseudomonas putida]|uniref:ATP-binding protein n=1 Tax=Pseudomonas putida TaxID=303 RepID=UPI001E4FB872|nr:ATP-binding protein [Pseudomonas putida]
MDHPLNRTDAIAFPKSFSSSDPTQVISLCTQINSTEGNVVLDASELEFIDPMGLAALRATLESLPDEKKYHVRWMREHLIEYLVRMDFFQNLDVDGVDTSMDPLADPDNCVELVRVDDGKSEEIASRLVHAMFGCDDVGTDQDPYRKPIEYALKELLENALSHARKEGRGGASVWVACQHFPTNGTVRIAIVDNGCGFLATLREHHQLPEQSHSAAIQTALLPRVSCNRGPLVAYETDSQNQGVGLTTTAKIAEAAGGTLIVASGNAWVHTASGATAVDPKLDWHGVAIAFSCNRDMLPLVNIPALLPAVEGEVDDEISFE